jgi:hypothetical protein
MEEGLVSKTGKFTDYGKMEFNMNNIAGKFSS